MCSLKILYMKGCGIMKNKDTQKTYTPSENLKSIVLAISTDNKKELDEILAKTKKTRNCIVATASSKNNKLYITYHSKCKVEINNELVEQKAYIELTDLGKELLKELTANDN